MLELFQLIPRVAQTDSPVLIVGETGVGKELVAAAIHRHSKRHDEEFFTVNCGALTETLLESELFGHEQRCLHRRAQDEAGLLRAGRQAAPSSSTSSARSPTAMQVKLLRVLERMEVRPVGGSELVKVDVRIVAATNASLEEAVAAGTFREDLYYRLNVVQLQIPPLRERTEDIPLLAEIFRKQVRDGAVAHRRPGPRPRRRPAPAVLPLARQRPRAPERDRAGRHPDVRALHHGQRTSPSASAAKGRKKPSLPSFDIDEPLPTVVERMRGAVEREYLRRVLRKYRGHVGRVSEHAGLNRRTLYNKMQIYGLRREDFR